MNKLFTKGIKNTTLIKLRYKKHLNKYDIDIQYPKHSRPFKANNTTFGLMTRNIYHKNNRINFIIKDV